MDRWKQMGIDGEIDEQIEIDGIHGDQMNGFGQMGIDEWIEIDEWWMNGFG